MSERDVLGTFEEPLNEEDELIVLGPGEEAPEEESEETADDSKMTLSRDEFEALRNKSDSTSALTESFKTLAEKLNRDPETPANVAQKPGESEEEFAKRLEEMMFKPGQTGKAIQEAILRYVSPAIQQSMGAAIEAHKRVLELDPDTGPKFKRYKDEIEKKVGALPQNQRLMPGAYKWAYDQVVSEHQGEIIEELVAERVAKALEEQGIGPAGERKPAQKFDGETGMSAPAAGKRRKIYVKPEHYRQAELLNMDIQDYLRAKGIIKD